MAEAAGSNAEREDVALLRRRNAELAGRIADLSQVLHKLEAVSQLAASTVHDTRNALQVISGHVEVIEDEPQTAVVRDGMQAIRAATEHAIALSQDLMDLARRDLSHSSRLGTAEVLAGCRRVILGITRGRFECAFDVPPGLWPIDVDRQQLVAALINLTANSRDAMPEGGKLTIAARNEVLERPPVHLPPGEYVILTVADTGVGMSAEVLERATEPFFTTKKPGRGTGLGLPMVEAFVRRSGGWLAIRSTPGSGTRVEMLLPSAAATERVPATDSRIAERIAAVEHHARSASVRDAARAWGAAGALHGVPRRSRIEEALAGCEDDVVVFAVEGEGAAPPLRLVRMGGRLVEELTALWRTDGPPGEASVLAHFAASYREACATRLPVYEHARLGFGGGRQSEFERLVLPASTDGRNVTHLYSIVVVGRTTLSED